MEFHSSNFFSHPHLPQFSLPLHRSMLRALSQPKRCIRLLVPTRPQSPFSVHQRPPRPPRPSFNRGGPDMEPASVSAPGAAAVAAAPHHAGEPKEKEVHLDEAGNPISKTEFKRRQKVAAHEKEKAEKAAAKPVVAPKAAGAASAAAKDEEIDPNK